jgi:hypothetical protein
VNGQNNVGPNTIEHVNGNIEYTGFETLSVVIMRSATFWKITPCSPLKFVRVFGGIFCLDFQVRRMSQAKNQHKVGSKLDVGRRQNSARSNMSTFQPLDIPFPDKGFKCGKF